MTAALRIAVTGIAVAWAGAAGAGTGSGWPAAPETPAIVRIAADAAAAQSTTGATAADRPVRRLLTIYYASAERQAVLDRLKERFPILAR